MKTQKVVDLLEQKCGESRFTEIVLKIHASGEISELNFVKNDIEEIILPLVQLGLIRVESKYFPIRPIEEKTRYNVFSISYQGEHFVKSILTKFDPAKKVDFIVNKYPPKFLAFMLYSFMSGGEYDEGSEDEYKQLMEKERLSKLADDFKRDMEKLKCAFWIKRHSSKRIEPNERTFIILSEFIEVCGQQIPEEVIDQEMEEFNLANLVESSLLKPQARNEWYEEFIDRIEREELQNLWTSWKEKLSSESVLLDRVVLDANKLRSFLDEKIEKIRVNLIGSSGSEERARTFLKILQDADMALNKSDFSDILAFCEDRKDFSIFISTGYKILHDQLHIRDEEVVDPIRCYFHHGKQDKRHEQNKAKFESFCRNCLISFEPLNGEWQILKDRILEKMVESVKRTKESS